MYSIGIRLEKIERRKTNNRLLHIASGLFLLIKSVDYLRYQHYEVWLIVTPFFLVGLFSLIYGTFKKQYDRAESLNNVMRIVQSICFAILAILMYRQQKILDSMLLGVWSLLCFFLLFTEKRARKPMRLVFSPEEILVPGAYVDQRLRWTDIRDIVIKQDYVTIFKPNNRYMQWEVSEDIAHEYLREAQQFCHQQLKAHEVSSSA